MTELATAERIVQAAPSAPDQGLTRLGRWLVLLLVVGLALHSWPVGGAGGRQVLWPANLVLLVWTVLAGIGCCQRSWRERIVQAMPPASVWAYLAICLLSVAAADHGSRAVTSAAKIWVCCLGVYTLVGVALTDRQRVQGILAVLCAVTAVTVGVALVQCMSGGRTGGRFESPLKLGTFLAMVVPVAWGWLVSWPNRKIRAGAVVLACGGLLACGSVWAFAGMAVGIFVAGSCRRDARRWLPITALAATATLGAAWSTKALVALRQDACLAEADGVDLRQRYLEWQAMVNLLAERPIVGAGIGCLNDHRSEYYLRLPKRNTIAPFDQNGWLAAAAETGLLGLACLGWVFLEHISICWKHRREVAGCVVLAGLAGAAVANVGSSVQYAGLWPGFVLLLALTGRAATVAGEEA